MGGRDSFGLEGAIAARALGARTIARTYVSSRFVVWAFIAFFLLATGCVGTAQRKGNLRLSIFIVHEGARTPESTEYVNIFDPKSLKLGGKGAYGPTLTSTGANQMAEAGIAIRNMTFGVLPMHYDPMEFYSRASGEPSALMSASALVKAVYPESNPAIFSKSASHDYLLHGMQHCGYYSERLEHVHSSKEWKKKEAEYDGVLAKATAAVRKQEGAEKHPAIKLETLYPLWDYLHSMFVGRGEAGLPAGLSADDYVELSKALSWVVSKEFRVPSGKEGRPGEVLGTLVGGPFLNHLHDLLTATMKPGKPIQPPTTVYITQAQSMMSLLSALRIPVEAIPEFGSVVAVQVFMDKGSEQGIVQVTANGVPVDMAICPGGLCPLQDFAEGVNHIKPGGGWGRDCKKSTREVIHNAVIHMPWPWLVLTGVICMVIVAVSVYYTGRGKRQQASRSSLPAYAGLPVDDDGSIAPSGSGSRMTVSFGDDHGVGSWKHGGPSSLPTSEDGDVTPRGRFIHSIN